jgi:hypothetical protein
MQADVDVEGGEEKVAAAREGVDWELLGRHPWPFPMLMEYHIKFQRPFP